MVWKNDQVSEKETEKILEIAQSCLEILGDFVELGCYKGDTSLLLAEVVEKYVENSVEKPVEKLVEKRLWIYDSFEGLPKKNVLDESVLGVDFREGELYTTRREIKERFLRAGLKVPVIKKAWFSDLTSADLPEKVAFSFLDGDFYESIRDSLRLLDGKMAPGAVIIVHDYANPALPGVAKAVEEWNRERGYEIVRDETMAIIRV